ncbi:DNA repair protein RecO, partial [Desulfovibrio sp.]
MEWTDQALVLRMGAFRESDLWLKLLCREHGLLTLFAFGGSRSRRRFCGCLDVLNSLHCRVRSSKDGRFLNLEEAALLQGPRLLRRNWQRMGLAANCLRFVEAMGVGEDAATEAFLLVEDLRAVLEAEKAPPVLLPLYFRLRLAGALGFAPNLGQCGRCGRTISEDAL